MPLARQVRRIGLCHLMFWLTLLFHGSGIGLAHAQTQHQTNLATRITLVLHSYESNVPVFLGTDEGISDTLQTGGIPSLNVFFESLELRRNSDPEHRKLLVEQMRVRYGYRKLGMIITMYPEALEFILKDCRDVFPDVPILALYLPQNFEVFETNRPIHRACARGGYPRHP